MNFSKQRSLEKLNLHKNSNKIDPKIKICLLMSSKFIMKIFMKNLTK